jgi:pSer/pThr/pTyr-binding forkhead associated (FHA) protein
MTDDPAGGHQAGFFEALDGLAHVLREPLPPAVAAARSKQPPLPKAVAAEAAPFRPRLRDPLALLHVVDDGREDGEVVRLRGDRLVIGRSEGDVVVPHDISMSPRHAALERLADGGWRLLDLGSSGGTFVRVTHARLRHGGEIQLGGTRLVFQEVDLTEAWFVEVRPAGDGRRHECLAPGVTIGRGGSGVLIALSDPFVSPIHAHVRRTQRGWRIENAGLNGLWVRIDGPVAMHGPSQFLCGEQRFVLEPLG